MPKFSLEISRSDSQHNYCPCLLGLLFTSGGGGVTYVHLAAFLKSKCITSQTLPKPYHHYFVLFKGHLLWGRGWEFLHIYPLFHTCLLSKSTLLTKAAGGQSAHGELCRIPILQSRSCKLCLDNEMEAVKRLM